MPRAPHLPYLPRRIAPVASATSIPFEAAKAHWTGVMSWPTGLYADSMTTSEPLPNLLGFIAADDKEFQASLARDTRIRFAGMNPQVTPSEEPAAMSWAGPLPPA